MVAKKDGSLWHVDFWLGGRQGRRVRVKNFETKAAAQRYEREQRNSYDERPYDFGLKDDRKMLELLDTWYQLYGHSLKDEKYRYSRTKAVIEAMKNPMARRFSSKHFADYRLSRLSKGISPETLNHELRYLRAVFNELKRLDQWEKPNPLEKIRLLPVPETDLTYLEMDQVSNLLEECQRSRNTHTYPIALVCLHTGARWLEAETLTRGQVKNGKIRFSKTKNSKSRTVPISSEIQDFILDSGFPGRNADRIFDGARGAFRSAYQRAGLSESTPGQLTHILRHTFASHFIMNGGHILTLQKILGHGSLTMTMRYAHLSPEYLEDAIALNPMNFMKKE
ncbi:phage integrase [Endozoicomonas acroporae]|uniref:phage integrase n=1 Tax=Endozoicomonas acroporae TaxID=1701104 RepID=UPI003D7B0631